MNPDHHDRRSFLRQASLAALALSLGPSAARAQKTVSAPIGRRKVALFTKVLHWMELERMADLVAECGFDGLDLTVRPGGHIEPGRAKDELPRFAEAMRKVGKEIVMLTTAINSADSPHAEEILMTAARLGIRYYRTDYFRYKVGGDIEAMHDDCVAHLKGLAALNAAYGLKGGYQNHAGTFVGSPVWDLGLILRRVASPWIGCQYDIRHAMVEGANTWVLGFDYLKPYINTFIFKDYHWVEESHRGKPVNVPLGDGIVDFEAYRAKIATTAADLPVTLHMEYDLGGAQDGLRDVKITPAEMAAALKRNRAVITRTLGY